MPCAVQKNCIQKPFHLRCLECRQAKEQADLKALKKRSAAPQECGWEIVDIAPARGKLAAIHSYKTSPDYQGGWQIIEDGYRGRRAARKCDVFDMMQNKSKARGVSSPFSSKQIETARKYRALHERCQSFGFTKTRIFEHTPLSMNKSGKDYMDMAMIDLEQLRKMHTIIGDGIALNVRAGRHSDCNDKRMISDRALVDMVCLRDFSMKGVLEMFGWCVTTKRRKALQNILQMKLNDMKDL